MNNTETLYSFQVEAINRMAYFFGYNPERACYNACEMGLGKTIQAVTIARTLECKRILIICPAIMRLVWEKEWLQWNNYSTKYEAYRKDGWVLDTILSSADWKDDGLLNPLGRTAGKLVLIISYDLAAKPGILADLAASSWDMLIMDEAHYLKNGRAKRTKAVLQHLWQKSFYRLALSGTPFTTRVVDGYTLFHRMLPQRFPDFPSFANEFSYCQIKHIGGRTIRDYFGVKNADVLKNIIRSNFYVRYTKDEVLKELPPKVFTKIPLPIKYAVLPKSTKAADELKLEAEAVRRALETDRPVPIPASLAEHRRLQGERKVEPVSEFISDLLEQDLPVVVYAWHKNVIAALSEAFSAHQPAVITGETSPRDREREVLRFQSGGTRLFIGNFIAAGVGITLTASSTVVLAELDWSPATISQAIDRLHRIGQKDTVNVYYFVVENSIDEAISNTVMARTRTFRSVLEQ